MGGNSTRVCRAIRPDKKHPCWREFVRPWNREAWLLVNPPEASFCGDCGAPLGNLCTGRYATTAWPESDEG